VANQHQIFDNQYSFFCLLNIDTDIIIIIIIIKAFGDSTCDNGNGTYTLLNHTYPPSPPYYNGRFSNGPVFMEYLSNILNATLYDYAYGGATSDNTYVTGKWYQMDYHDIVTLLWSYSRKLIPCAVF